MRAILRPVLAIALAALVCGAASALAQGRGVVVEIKESEQPGAPVVERVPLYQKSYALVIGIDAYSNGWPRLSNAVKDAEEIAASLKGFDEVILRRDLPKARLERELEDFFYDKGQDPDTRLLLWFAGHGETLDNEGFLVAADAPLPTTSRSAFLRASLPMRRFGELVRLAKAKHVIAVFDSCFSGTIFETQRARVPPAITRVTRLPVRQFVSSGQAGQKVSDDGTFRKLFVRALTGEERADANGDGYLTASELGLFLTDRMTNLTRNRQTPQYGALRDAEWDRGDTVFVLPRRERDATETLPPRDESFSLDDLKRQEEARAGWERRQQQMRAAFQEADQFSGGAALKRQAWDRFLAAFEQDNPFSSEDEELRTKATVLRAAIKEVAVVPPPPPPPPPKGGVQQIVGIYPEPRAEFRDYRKDGAPCPECPHMVVIPPGSFTMGSPASEAERDSDEGPQHQVRIGYALAVGKYEVTRGEFAAFVRETGRQMSGGCFTWNGEKWDLDTAKSWQNPGFSQGDRHPVLCVNWDDATAYVRWLSTKTGKSYRLLSEAVWEYAARAGTTTARYWGDGQEGACKAANVSDATRAKAENLKQTADNIFLCEDGYVHTAPVGSFGANRFGLHDMLGNVWEWVEDVWHDDYKGAPLDGSAWVSGGDQVRRVLRGGSWYYEPRDLRSANRSRDDTGLRNYGFGFRVARTN